MSATITNCGQSAKAKYAHRRRLRTIQNASLLLILFVSLATGFMSLSRVAKTSLYTLGIFSSMVGSAAIGAHFYLVRRDAEVVRRGEGD